MCVLLGLNKFDPERFHPPGLDFRGKLIGIEDVPDARGDKMCQVMLCLVILCQVPDSTTIVICDMYMFHMMVCLIAVRFTVLYSFILL